MNNSTFTSNAFPKASPLEVFAQRHRLKLTRDSCGDRIVAGRYGDVADHGDGQNLLAAFWGNGPKFSKLRAARIRRALEESYGRRHAGGIGADESLIIFDPTDQRSAQFFVKALGIHRRRRASLDVVQRLKGFIRPTGRAVRALETSPITTLDSGSADVFNGGAK